MADHDEFGDATPNEFADLVAATLKELGKPTFTDSLAPSEAEYLVKCLRENRSRIEIVSGNYDNYKPTLEPDDKEPVFGWSMSTIVDKPTIIPHKESP